MPIKSENRHRYLKGYKWQSLRGAILSRSKNCCEHCGVENNILRNGKRVHLAVAHLDQCPENNQHSNLAALCQWCHLKHDQPFRVIHAKITCFIKARAFNLDLFGFDYALIESDYFRFKKAAF
jgi:hypothetical protein